MQPIFISKHCTWNTFQQTLHEIFFLHSVQRNKTAAKTVKWPEDSRKPGQGGCVAGRIAHYRTTLEMGAQAINMPSISRNLTAAALNVKRHTLQTFHVKYKHYLIKLSIFQSTFYNFQLLTIRNICIGHVLCIHKNSKTKSWGRDMQLHSTTMQFLPRRRLF